MVCEIQNIESNFEEALDLSTSVSSKVKLMAVWLYVLMLKGDSPGFVLCRISPAEYKHFRSVSLEVPNKWNAVFFSEENIFPKHSYRNWGQMEVVTGWLTSVFSSLSLLMGEPRNMRPTELLCEQMRANRSLMDRRNRSSARELVCLILCLVALPLQLLTGGGHLLLLLLPFHSVIPSDPTKVDITEMYKPTNKNSARCQGISFKIQRQACRNSQKRDQW